jgi:lipid-A-disaccharide synthase
MAAAGVHLVADVTQHAPVALIEPLGSVPVLLRAFWRLLRALRAERPRALILIDFPDFNLPLALLARLHGIPIIYFVPPDVWAWRPRRAWLLAKLRVHILAVFSFEAPIYARAGTPVEFVGHPLLDVLPRELTREEARRALGVPPDAPLIGMLPGSRRAEITRLLPAMLRAASLIRERRPDVLFLAAPPPLIDPVLIERILGGADTRMATVQGRTYELMVASDLLLVASGTATLEAALLGTPMVVSYRLSPLVAAIGRLLQRIPWISLPNILCDHTVVPELLQDDATGDRLAAEALDLLEHPEKLAAQRLAFQKVEDSLGEPGAGERAAQSVLRLVGYPDESSAAIQWRTRSDHTHET